MEKCINRDCGHCVKKWPTGCAKSNFDYAKCEDFIADKKDPVADVTCNVGLGALTIKEKTKKENIMTPEETVVADMLLAAIDKAENSATPGNATDRSRAICDYETFISAACRRASIK